MKKYWIAKDEVNRHMIYCNEIADGFCDVGACDKCVVAKESDEFWESRKLQQWIDAEDRLPEESGHYQCVVDNKIHILYYVNEYEEFQYVDEFCKLTHWMSLPDLPEDKPCTKE